MIIVSKILKSVEKMIDKGINVKGKTYYKNWQKL